MFDNACVHSGSEEDYVEANRMMAWKEKALFPAILPNAEPPPEEALPAGGLALLSADTDRTQQFVFQSARLPEIRGASMRLDNLNRRLLDLLSAQELPITLITDPDSPGCVIYCGGGGLLALVPGDLAAALIADIEALYPRQTTTATITAVSQPITIAAARGLLSAALTSEALGRQQAALPPAMQARLAGSIDLKAVQRIMRQQGVVLRQRKQAKVFVPHVETDPHARVCQSCGRRPASHTLTGIPDEAARYLCQVCHENDDHGRKHKSAWNVKFVNWAKKTHGVTLDAPQADDLHEIGEAAKGYIGYIYADGNSIGKLLEQADSLTAYSRLSQALEKATETAVFAALFKHLYKNSAVLPFEIITIGGDDVLLIVPAHTALPVARDICAGFGDNMAPQANAGKLPSMSAGVAIAQDSNPIYFVHDLSRQLLKSAKKGTQKRGGAHLDFMVLKSQSTLAARLDDVRTSAYLQIQDEAAKERCLLTARPYALADADKLLNSIKALKDIRFSSGQLHQMRREFQNGRFPGLFYYLYQRTRLNRTYKDYAQILSAIELEWGMVEAKDGAPPWIALSKQPSDDYQEFTTPWLDILELHEFIA